MHELMSIPFAEADLHERNLKLRCLMRVGLKFADLNKRAAESQQRLEALHARASRTSNRGGRGVD